MIMYVVPGAAIHGQAPPEGFRVVVSPNDVLSEAYGMAPLDWVRSVLFCRFPAGAPVKVEILIR